MKIGIIGATGKAGSDIYKEAITRGHEVTAIVREEIKAKSLLGDKVTVLEKDAFDLTREDLNSFDVIVNAFATEPSKAYRHVDLAAKLVALFREAKSPRIIFILGAGSLKTGEDKHLFVEDIKVMPGSEAWVSIPENQLKELLFLKEVDNVNWVGISPSAIFEPGEKKDVVLGQDELLIAPDGSSHTTTGTMALAVLDEIENPKHHQERFTVRDK
ncbi:NAD(P)H-binding protein [Clostridium sp. YIM B02515]|uniref:NAD(P)H-binding protein n=1 Tax=Clostridium rhizosphaerae TaxID=2803861 RepID=A0ABS1TEP6_9CLOT|nr:NAD(P)H-binding protein [Clostridium rhizosphaerae]MBL4937820.1 NAD(P)H-binding protein [Clostridium rhizosphaerae]